LILLRFNDVLDIAGSTSLFAQETWRKRLIEDLLSLSLDSIGLSSLVLWLQRCCRV